jgi:hypothetical protein
MEEKDEENSENHRGTYCTLSMQVGRHMEEMRLVEEDVRMIRWGEEGR